MFSWPLDSTGGALTIYAVENARKHYSQSSMGLVLHLSIQPTSNVVLLGLLLRNLQEDPSSSSLMFKSQLYLEADPSRSLASQHLHLDLMRPRVEKAAEPAWASTELWGRTFVLKPQSVLVCHASTLWAPVRITLLDSCGR